MPEPFWPFNLGAGPNQVVYRKAHGDRTQRCRRARRNKMQQTKCKRALVTVALFSSGPVEPWWRQGGAYMESKWSLQSEVLCTTKRLVASVRVRSSSGLIDPGGCGLLQVCCPVLSVHRSAWEINQRSGGRSW